MGYINNILKYTPSSLYGKHKFLYGEKRKLNYWFKYYLFPVYGRYLFLYNPQDNIIIEHPFFLERTAHNINTVEKTIAVDKAPTDEIGMEQEINLEAQRRKLEIERKFVLRRGDYHFDNSIHNDYKIEREIENMGLVNTSSILEKKKEVIAGSVESYILDKMNTFDLLQDKLFENIKRIDYNIEHFVTHALKSETRDVNIFTIDDFIETENKKIIHLSDFILSKISREMLQEDIMSLGAIPRELITNSTNDNFQVVIREMSLAMQKDKTLKRVIEDMYLYELEIKKLERELYNAVIQEDTVNIELAKQRSIITDGNEKSSFTIGEKKAIVMDQTVKGEQSQSDKIDIVDSEKRFIQLSDGTNIAIEHNGKETHKLRNDYDASKTEISIEKVMQINAKEDVETTIYHNEIEIDSKESKHANQTDNQMNTNKHEGKKSISITNNLTMFDERVEKYIKDSDTEVVINDKIAKICRDNKNEIEIDSKESNNVNESDSQVNTYKPKGKKGISITNNISMFDEKVKEYINHSDTEVVINDKVAEMARDNKNEIEIDSKESKHVKQTDDQVNVSKREDIKGIGITNNLTTFDEKVNKYIKHSDTEVVINDKVAKIARDNNEIEIDSKESKNVNQTDNQVNANKCEGTKDIGIRNNLTTFDGKVKKYIEHLVTEVCINDKVAEISRDNDNETEVTDKVSKASTVVNAKSIDCKVSTPIVINNNECLFHYEVPRLIESEWNKIELGTKIPQSITMANRQDFIINGKVNKPIILIDHENIFKSVSKEKEGIDIDTINIDTPFVRLDRKYTRDIILDKEVVDLTTSKVSKLDISTLENLVNELYISNSIDTENVKPEFHFTFKFTARDLDIVTDKTNFNNKAQIREVQNLNENSVLSGKIPSREIHNNEIKSTFNVSVPSREVHNLDENSVLSGKIPSREIHNNEENSTFNVSVPSREVQNLNRNLVLSGKMPSRDEIHDNDKNITLNGSVSSKEIQNLNENSVLSGKIPSCESHNNDKNSRFNVSVPSREVQNLDKNSMLSGKICSSEIHNNDSTLNGRVISRKVQNLNENSILRGKIPSRENKIEERIEIGKVVRNTINEQYFNSDVELKVSSSSGINYSDANEKYLNIGNGQDVDILQDRGLEKNFDNTDVNQIDNQVNINKRKDTKSISITNNLIMADEKVEKYIKHLDTEVLINDKIAEISRYDNNETKLDKVSKASIVVNTEGFIDCKVSKPIVINNNERLFDYEVPRLVESEWNEVELGTKIQQSITMANKQDFIINGKENKPIILIDHENIFKSVSKEKEGIDIDTINIDTPLVRVDRKYTKDIILNKEVIALTTSKVAKLVIANSENLVNKLYISDSIDVEEIEAKLNFNFTFTANDLDIVTDKINFSNKAQIREVQNLEENSVSSAKIPNREIQNNEKNTTFNGSVPSREVRNLDENSILSGKTPSRENKFEERIEIGKGIRNTVDEQYFNTDVELKVTPSSGINNSDINGKYLNTGDGQDVDILQNKGLEKDFDNTNVKFEELKLLKSEQRKIKEEVETRLDMHKRFWFVKSHGKIDNKILPNRDFNYPPNIAIFDKVIDEIYRFNYNTEFVTIEGCYVVEAYDENYRKVAEHIIPIVSDYDSTIDNINVKIEIRPTGHNSTAVRFDIGIYNLTNVQYMIIRQPKDYKGNEVLYTVTEKLLREKHPIPFGDTLGLVEIELHIPIMVDFINILLLMWSKFYMAFTGYTGTRAVYGLVNVVYDWLMLDTSLEQNTIAEYHRCFRWLRWEAEKVSNKAKYDPDLSGNLWVEELIYEIIDYMETHHVNELPEFDPINKMDEYRQLFCDPSFDIPVIVDKYKGIRKRVIDKHKRYND